MLGHYKLEGKVAIPCEDIKEWGYSFGHCNRRVAIDDIGDVRVSTVFLGLDLHTDGYTLVVSFLGNSIWNSDDDERDYFEENDKYEPLKSYLLRKINEMLGWLKTFDPYFGQEEVEDGQEC